MSALDATGEAIIAAYLTNGGNQSEAWKAAHPNSRARPQSIAVEASRFFSRPNVRLRLAEVQSEVAQKATAALCLTLESHVSELEALRNMAKERGQLAAAIKAEELLGQLGRHYVKQVHATGSVDHQHTHVTEPISETVEWIRGVLGGREKRQAPKLLPN